MKADFPPVPPCVILWDGCKDGRKHQCDRTRGHKGPHRCGFCGATLEVEEVQK